MSSAPLTLKDFQEKSIAELKGVGGKRIEEFKNIGIENLADLLRFYPHTYLDRQDFATINTMEPDTEANILATVQKVGRAFRTKKRNLTIVNVSLEDSEGTPFETIFFNQPWRERQLQEGAEIVIFGKLKSERGKIQMTNPVVDVVGGAKTGRIVPIYKLPKFEKIYPVTLFKAVEETLRRSEERGIYDPLDASILKEQELLTRKESLCGIHLPETFPDITAARKRLAFDELLCIQLVLLDRKEKLKEVKGLSHKPKSGEFELVERFLKELPYELTDAQKKVIQEIRNDLVKDYSMNRLLQGDVGSGKTIVAITAILAVIQAGHQAAFLVPTEVLAEQHFSVVTKLLENLIVPDGERLENQRQLSVELLSNRVTGNERKRLLSDLKSGKVDLVVGTSALIYEGVEFESLGLVVVDEQHRFGVNQRAELKEKSNSSSVPDSLAMTATPIPRTVALTIYGDLDISVLDELPAGRIPIETKLITDKTDEAEMWQHVRQQADQGRQVYVVCPLIGTEEELDGIFTLEEDEEDETAQTELTLGLGDEGKNGDEAKNTKTKRPFKLDINISVKKVYENLSVNELSGLKLEMLHGQLSTDEKNAIMEDFRAGNIDVLVSTTVIEVGVDVPNATMMVIYGAYRFGIAQLHQLRGRVGRSDIKSYCYLVSDMETERLEAVAETTDGFLLAEKDLDIRRAGTLLGERQTGKSDLRATSLLQHKYLVEPARQVAAKLLADGQIEQAHPEWLDEIKFLLGIDEQTEYLAKT